jgi:ABC-type uncharacterized transport system YnjBCD ATPase subunit
VLSKWLHSDAVWLVTRAALKCPDMALMAFKTVTMAGENCIGVLHTDVILLMSPSSSGKCTPQPFIGTYRADVLTGATIIP